jgi:hypothetical protein
MKKRSALVLAALVAIAAPQAIEATPYASKIRLASTSFAAGAGTTITYVLNQAATSTTIEIIDSLNNVVASFAGTATAGSNSVVWNGTVDNASGAIVPTGAGYRVRITANGPSLANWTRYKTQGAVTSVDLGGDKDVVDDFFPKGLAINTDPDSDHFGTTLVSFGYVQSSGTLAPCIAAAMMEFNADLEVAAGDNGYASRVLRHPNDDGTLPHPRSYTVWGAEWDPYEPNRVWWTGQATVGSGTFGTNAGSPEYFTGVGVAGVLPPVATNADPNSIQTNGLFPRSISVRNYGGTKYAFVTRGNAVIEVFSLNAANEFQTAIGNILDGNTLGSTTRYSKNVRFDSANNLYWMSQRINTTPGAEDGRVYRWDAATVAAAIADPVNAKLTGTNASWTLINDIGMGTRRRIEGLAINAAGDVYVLTSFSILNVGNVSTPTLNLNLSTLIPVIETNIHIRPGTFMGAGVSELQFDAAGNLIVVEGGGENIVAFAPPSAVPTTTTFLAPPSQTFTITASTADWEALN